MRMFQIWIFFAAMTGLLWSQPQQISSNGMYWPTGSSSRTSQIYSQTPGLGGTWLAPGPMIDSVTGIQTPRYTQDQTGSVRIGSYFTNEFHLGFDILNDTSEEHHPIYALADGQIMHLSYGQPGASQDTFGNGGWGNTDCAEIGLLNSSLVLPSVCNDNQRAGNVALVVKYKLADGRTFYAVYGHLIDTNETPRSMPGATLLEGDVKQDCTKELDSDITGIASAEQVQSAPKRPFHPCDIFTAGELIGYTGDWPHTRHLHFGIAPYKMVVTNLGLSAYDSSTWPDDGSVVNCYDSDGVSHNCLPTGFLQADGTYLDQVNPISFITDPNNVPSNWMQTMGIETTVGAPPIFADFFASAVEYNWSYTSEGDQGPTLTYVPGKVTIQVPVLSSGSSSGTLVSNQHFSGNIDVTFNVNLTGKGESIVGLYSETSGWLTFADLHATATPELLFYSPLGPNPPAYSCTSCFGRSIGIRITVVGSLVYFYLDGNATPVAEINVTPLSDYVLYMYAGDNQYYGGANTTNFYSVVVHSGTMLEPDPSTVPTIAQFAPSSTPISGRSFDGLLSGSQFGPNTQIWFCTESNTSQCYRQPAAGVVPNADGSSVQVNAVGLSAGNWKVKARNNIGAWSNYSDSFSVLTAPPVLFSEDFSTDPSNRWIYTSGGATITFQPGELTIFEPQTYASAMYVSNQQFTSDIDVTFKLNHSGYGETLAGLFVPSTNSWLAFATISASSTFSGISFYSAGFANPPQYSCQSCSNRDITVRVKTSNGQVMFYIDGDVNPIATTGFNAPQGYALLIYADNNPYFGGANTSIFYHVEVASGTLLN